MFNSKAHRVISWRMRKDCVANANFRILYIVCEKLVTSHGSSKGLQRLFYWRGPKIWVIVYTLIAIVLSSKNITKSWKLLQVPQTISNPKQLFQKIILIARGWIKSKNSLNFHKLSQVRRIISDIVTTVFGEVATVIWKMFTQSRSPILR